MAREPQKQSAQAEALIKRLEASREGLGEHLTSLREAVDVPARIKRSVKSRPLVWFGGSLAAGLVVSRVLRRPRRKAEKGRNGRKKRRVWGFIFTTLFTLLKPTLKSVITSELQRRFIAHAAPKQGDR